MPIVEQALKSFGATGPCSHNHLMHSVSLAGLLKNLDLSKFMGKVCTKQREFRLCSSVVVKGGG